MKLRIIVTLLLTLSATSKAYETDGYSKYKLIFVRNYVETFNPNQDLLNPSAREISENALKEKMMNGIIGGLIPLAQNLKSENNNNLGDAIMASASVVAKNLTKELSNVTTSYQSKIQTMLIPFNEALGPQNNLFYNSHKISSSGEDIVNYLKVPITHPSFSTNATQSIKAVQNFYFINGQKFGTSYLLGTVSSLEINGPQRSLKISVLLGIKPNIYPFTNTSPMVNFKNIELPEIVENNNHTDLSALIDFEFDLTTSAENNYKANIHFGAFDRFENGKFILLDKNKDLWAPRLIGNINKPNLQMIAANFSIPEIQMDLKLRQVTGMTTYTSIGIEYRSKRLLLGGIHLGKVDNDFRNEINKTIDSETQKAVNGAIEKAQSLILNKILGITQ